MAVDTNLLPQCLDERIDYITRKIRIYESIAVDGFRSNCANDLLHSEAASDDEFQSAVDLLFQNVVERYRGLNLSILDNDREFSFVYSILDIFDHLEECYKTYRTSSDQTMKSISRRLIHQDATGLKSLGNIYEHNLRFYERELERLER